jgi:hypothetical protein
MRVGAGSIPAPTNRSETFTATADATRSIAAPRRSVLIAGGAQYRDHERWPAVVPVIAIVLPVTSGVRCRRLLFFLSGVG